MYFLSFFVKMQAYILFYITEIIFLSEKETFLEVFLSLNIVVAL